MLTALDETFLHQVPVTFDQTTISDHRFFDRMWLSGCCAGDVRFMTGMAAYKNTNTFDGYFTAYRDRRQYNLRLSRSLLPDPASARLGPLSIEIIEPLKTLRVVVEPGAGHGLAADILFEATTPVREELAHRRRVDGRLFQDYLRFDQIGRTRGWMEIEGQRVTFDRWFGARDHSWGVRPGMGGYEPMTAAVDLNDNHADIGAGQQGFFAIYLFFDTPSMWGLLQKQEDGAGRVLHEEGDIAFRDRGETLRVRTIEHDLTFAPGTRVCNGGRLTLAMADSSTVVIDLQPQLPPWCYKGTGYDSGYNDERGLGLHRGNLLEYDVYDLSGDENVILPDGRIVRPWHRELTCALTVNGEAGFGHLPVLSTGSIKRYGLDGAVSNRRPS